MKKVIMVCSLLALAACSEQTVKVETDPIGDIITSSDVITKTSRLAAPVIPEDKPAVITKEARCLIDNVFHEARGESLKGQMMVASVTLSRAEDHRWPNSICEVVYQKMQFSWTALSKKELARRVKRDQAAYRKITDYVIKWLEHDTIPRSNVYHYARYEVNNYWTKVMTPVEKIGAHVFYVHDL